MQMLYVWVEKWHCFSEDLVVEATPRKDCQALTKLIMLHKPIPLRPSGNLLQKTFTIAFLDGGRRNIWAQKCTTGKYMYALLYAIHYRAAGGKGVASGMCVRLDGFLVNSEHNGPGPCHEEYVTSSSDALEA